MHIKRTMNKKQEKLRRATLSKEAPSVAYEPIPLPHRQNLSHDEMQSRVDAYCEFVRKRHTVRDFSAEAVSKSVIESCLLAAGTAPSGANHQPWHFVCISDPSVKRKIRQAAEAEEQAFYGGKAGDR